MLQQDIVWTDADEVLRVENMEYSYENQGGKVYAVKQANGSFRKGKLYAIMGRSGSGKTTLMSLMAGLDLPQKGRIIFKGTDLADIDRDKYRSSNIGMIFQQFNLFQNYSALENVMVSLELCRYPGNQRKTRAIELLAKVGIDEAKAVRRVSKLSGGEQQRTAIARAIAPGPELILADEPTGNLDSETGKEVMQILLDLAHNDNCCVVVITHSKEVADCADEVWGMKDGKLVPVRV